MKFLLQNAARRGLFLMIAAGAGTAFAGVIESAECARIAVYQVSMTRDQAVQLCSNGGTPANAECARVAVYDVDMTRDQAADLCKNPVWPQHP
jgi:hypothetical protein